MTAAIEPIEEKVSDQWRTPPELYAYLYFVYGPFDIDLCASKDNALHPEFFSFENSAWTANWDEIERSNGHHFRIFANPPFSKPNLQVFSDLAADYAQKTPYCSITAVIPAATGTKWFKENVVRRATEILFLTGRPAFLDQQGKPQADNRYDICIVTWEHYKFHLAAELPKIRWVDLKDLIERGATYLERYKNVWNLGEGLKSYLQNNE